MGELIYVHGFNSKVIYIFIWSEKNHKEFHFLSFNNIIGLKVWTNHFLVLVCLVRKENYICIYISLYFYFLFVCFSLEFFFSVTSIYIAFQATVINIRFFLMFVLYIVLSFNLRKLFPTWAYWKVHVYWHHCYYLIILKQIYCLIDIW